MPVCDTALRFAQRDLYAARWSGPVLDEAQRSLLATGKWPADKIERRFRTIREHFPDARVDGFESLIETMTCDPGDRHVLAAAVRANADQIVTGNVRHFPNEAVAPYGIEVVTPDEFLSNILDLAPQIGIEVIREQVSALSRPALSIDDVLIALSKCGATQFAQTVDNMLRASGP